ncbi:glycogen debranching protein [Jatrophihabitans sp. YIM 134969]
MRRRHVLPLFLAAALGVPVLAAVVPATAAPAAAIDAALARSPELSTSTRLADRRSFTIGTRFWAVGAEDGTYPATGFHTRGEMGGFWSMPIKLLDGMWFSVNGTWLKGTRFTQGWGYTRTDLGTTAGVRISRTDVAPDGLRAGLVGLTLTSTTARTVDLAVDAHSELMSAYPWGETSPNQVAANLQDTGRVSGDNLVFTDRGTPPVPNSTRHTWSAVVGSTLTPTGSSLGPDHRGPQDPAVICPASGPDTPTPPTTCDDTAYGKGTGGQLRYRVAVPAGTRTVWFSVAGSDKSLDEALAQQRLALATPARLLNAKVAERRAMGKQTVVDLPGDRQLQDSVAWSKQNLLDSRQVAKDLQLRVTNAGTRYPAPVGTLASADWTGAGWPDYPWIFGTDGEYTAYALVASGQFDAIEAHLRTLRDVSEVVNRGSGKVVHEVVPDGSVYYGANSDPGNTDETVKFPSTVALVWRWTGDNAFRDEMYDFTRRNLRYALTTLDADGDGWPEGAGNVELQGMGEEKLDVAAYTIRGLRDLADMAASKNDVATVTWATSNADDLQRRFEKTWWVGGSARSYADSLENPDNTQVFQRHWIGLVPLEAELPATATQPARPVADPSHAATTATQHEGPCYTGRNGLFHTGTGATTVAAGNPGPTCDGVTSTLGSIRQVFTLTTSIAAVAEGAFGRMGEDQMQRYTDDIARVQLDPSVWEAPGLMPEIAPSPDFTANIDQPYYSRSMGLQAWGTYGILWPVVHFELGVAPDLGRRTVTVVPQVPDGQNVVSGSNVVVGSGSLDVTARRGGGALSTTVTRHGTTGALTLGVVLPTGAKATGATLDGRSVATTTVRTARGVEVRVAVTGSGATRALVVRYA